MSDSALRAADWKTDLPTLERSARDRVLDRVRWGLVGAWIVVIVCLPFVAERSSSWAHLKREVASGSVRHVEINHELFGGNGFSTVDLHWREHGLNYRAAVVQLVGDQKESDCGFDDACSDPSLTTVHSPPSTRLQELQPGLTVTRSQQGDRGADGSELLGFSVPWSIAIAELVLVLAALGLLISGPQTWRATKWGWFWWFHNPVGMAAFLLLSGPVPGLPAPRHVERRLTGGWSLLLLLAVSAVSVSIWGLKL